mmetsp:Transcript_17335/g.45249  ORF Transcript_17335/g.45249 Transcript_17335/m.45249 type:complete len:252 (+) Transcript_17335:583-1338(+)
MVKSEAVPRDTPKRRLRRRSRCRRTWLCPAGQHLLAGGQQCGELVDVHIMDRDAANRSKRCNHPRRVSQRHELRLHAYRCKADMGRRWCHRIEKVESLCPLWQKQIKREFVRSVIFAAVALTAEPDGSTRRGWPCEHRAAVSCVIGETRPTVGVVRVKVVTPTTHAPISVVPSGEHVVLGIDHAPHHPSGLSDVELLRPVVVGDKLVLAQTVRRQRGANGCGDGYVVGKGPQEALLVVLVMLYNLGSMRVV